MRGFRRKEPIERRGKTFPYCTFDLIGPGGPTRATQQVPRSIRIPPCGGKGLPRVSRRECQAHFKNDEQRLRRVSTRRVGGVARGEKTEIRALRNFLVISDS